MNLNRELSHDSCRRRPDCSRPVRHRPTPSRSWQFGAVLRRARPKGGCHAKDTPRPLRLPGSASLGSYPVCHDNRFGVGRGLVNAHNDYSASRGARHRLVQDSGRTRARGFCACVRLMSTHDHGNTPSVTPARRAGPAKNRSPRFSLQHHTATPACWPTRWCWRGSWIAASLPSANQRELAEMWSERGSREAGVASMPFVLALGCAVTLCAAGWLVFLIFQTDRARTNVLPFVSRHRCGRAPRGKQNGSDEALRAQGRYPRDPRAVLRDDVEAMQKAGRTAEAR